ncbi:MAG: HI0074 family nucleotidyltransferase substrate-binding subunit [Rickettsiaceae bacterium]|nr:HI0074 family nucleotidyltransferase substrate-binding subunit [Rickettsiaceae bacterium]
MQKITLKFEKFSRTLSSLNMIYLEEPRADRSNIDATIQRFEFTFELCWKFLKEFFLQKGLELNYPKDVIKEAFASGFIEDELLWLQMLKDRNMTSHTYDEILGDNIFQRIKNYVPLFIELKDKLAAHIE